MILQGHAIEKLRELPDESVHCVVTSPPYWGLRDYGIEPVVWDDPGGCREPWRRVVEPTKEYLKNIAGYYLNRNYSEAGLFAEYLKEQREHLGFSKKEIDEELGLNTAYSWWEGRLYGVQLPNANNYQKLKDVLGLDDRFDHLFEFVSGGKEKGGWCFSGCDPLIHGNKKEGPAMTKETRTIGWQPGCKHEEKPIPCTVLDPFGGAMTVPLVAEKLWRSWVAIEINPDYIKMGEERLRPYTEQKRLF